MGIRESLQNLLAKDPITSKDDQEGPVILANGNLINDTRDVENPVGKFSGPRHVRSLYRHDSKRRNVTFYTSEYDLLTIANAIQLDGLLRRSVTLFIEQILKNGFEFKSKKDSKLKHVRNRVREIENLTGISFKETIRQIADQLVSYGECFLVKKRMFRKSKFGKQYRLFGKYQNPIVGLFVADATTMKVGLGPSGKVIQYKQEVRGEHRIWDERDVIHFTYNKIPGALRGMSSIIPILDDVRALRKLEEEIEILGFQYSIPLYLYKVGNKDIPPAPGEVDEAAATVSNMPAYGMLVVPGNHTIEVPSNSNTPVDILEFVNHFKQRIFGGLGVSPVAMGESASSNRNTSEVLDKNMQGTTKDYQNIISSKLEMEFIRELLLDGGYADKEKDVEFSFPEIDIENQIKIETHILSLWQNNLLTRTEARVSMDKDPKIDESDTFLEKVEMSKIEAEQEGQKELANISAKASLQKSKASSSSSSSSKNNKTTSYKVRPANQYGRSSGRPKYKKDSVFNKNIFDKISIFDKDIADDTISKTRLELENMVEKWLGYWSDDININDIDNTDILDSYLDGVEIILKDKLNSYRNNADDELKSLGIKSAVSDFIDSQEDKIENLSKILIYQSFGYSTILITSDMCEYHHRNRNINIKNYRDIPPFRCDCKCKVDEDGLYELI